jgi:hypothetical protein
MFDSLMNELSPALTEKFLVAPYVWLSSALVPLSLRALFFRYKSFDGSNDLTEPLLSTKSSSDAAISNLCFFFGSYFLFALGTSIG